MMPLAALTVTGCLAVSAGSSRILAGELAAATPGVTVPAADIPVAFAPAPGVQRVFHVAELRRMAERFGWSGEPNADICVERPVSPPDPARFLAAMRKAMPDADIAIVEYGRQPLPDGDLEFSANGLHAGPAGALWIGYVRYADTRRFAVWARVKVLVPVTRLVAAVDLEPGLAITPQQVRTQTKPEFPPPMPVRNLGEKAIGMWPRTLIPAGAEIRAAMLETAKEVMKGDAVKVDLLTGAAHLELEAVAEGSGAVGETIPVLNPDSHKRFPARVEGKGRVSVGWSAGKVNP